MKINASDNTSNKILEASVLLFAKNGFEAVSIRDIAAEAQVSFSLIRHHHGKKEHLILACHRYALAKLEELYSDIDVNSVRSEKRVLLDYIMTSHQSLFGKRSVLLLYLSRMFTKDDDIANEAFDRYFNILAKFIDRVVGTGLINQDLNQTWLIFIVMFNQLGPAFLSVQINRFIGQDVYDISVIKERSDTFLHVLKKGVYK